MGGNRCVITGMGHHTTHSGKDWRFKSMSIEGAEDDARPAADRIATQVIVSSNRNANEF